MDKRISWGKSIPFFVLHALCITAIWTEFRWQYVAVCVGMYFFRMWAITGGYHRYFAHRSYKTGRVFQFFIALVGTLATQKGVLWWAANHRHHHKVSDQPDDIHSPAQDGFWWSHVGWILSDQYERTRYESIRDFAQYPEIRWLNENYLAPPMLLGLAFFLLGGYPLLLWGFFISTVLLWHGTFTINSLSHVFGSRRYKTTDTSRNNFLLALITCGEGWHNNHHYHQNTANQGWFWWEVDATYYVLKLLSFLGIVWDLRLPSPGIKFAHLRYSEQEKEQLRKKPLIKLPEPALASALVSEVKQAIQGAGGIAVSSTAARSLLG